jgi:hypothetical protein
MGVMMLVPDVVMMIAMASVTVVAIRLFAFPVRMGMVLLAHFYSPYLAVLTLFFGRK